MGKGISSRKIVEACGGYANAVNVVMALGRALWEQAFVAESAPAGDRPGPYRVVDEARLLEKLEPETRAQAELVLDYLRAKRVLRTNKQDSSCFDLSVFQPVALVRQVLGRERPDYELRYFVMRSIRTRYGCVPSPETAYLFNLLAPTIDALRRSGKENSLLSPIDFKDMLTLLVKLRDGLEPVPRYIRRQLSLKTRELLDGFDGAPSEGLQEAVIEELNRLLLSPEFYNQEDFQHVSLTNTFKAMIKGNPEGENLIQLNRYLLTSAFPKEIARTGTKFLSMSGRVRAPKNQWHYAKELLPYLRQLLKADLKFTDLEGDARQAVDLFIECCRATDYIRAHYKPGYITIQTATIDAEFLLTTLFGMPTGIRGFDDLFGGGGLMLAEGPQPVGSPRLKGRTILIMGRFGTGKSLLSLQLAVEVARKGGLAWVMPLEQSADECLYALESMRALPNDRSVDIASKLQDAREIVSRRTGNERGALVIVTTNVKDSFEAFSSEFTRSAGMMLNYPLRLICVDPVNSIFRSNQVNIRELRAKTLEMIRVIKESGTNVLLIAEEDTDKESEPLFEQNIADTVIHLSVQERYGYAQRYLEIKKSRLQREQRGKHPYSIRPGSGPTIYPSSAAVSNRIRPRGIHTPDQPVRYGVSSVDKILGTEAIAQGDVIAFQGQGGSFKTPLGLLFLLDTDWDPYHQQIQGRRNFSLLIAARDNEESIRHLLGQDFVREHQNQLREYYREQHGPHLSGRAKLQAKAPEDIIIRSIPKGNVNPSFILQQIADEFLAVHLRGHSIDRVMIDNIAHWEMSCPYVREDATFADTLVDFLRRQGVTSLLVCGQLPAGMPAVIQRPIIDNADCVVRFERVEFKGTQRVIIRAMKTRGMRHRLESFELMLGPRTFELRPNPSLLRIGQNGQVAPVPTRLFLHSETQMQAEYNERFLRAVRLVLSRDTHIETQDRLYFERTTDLGSSSAVDELQALQLDEFQVPSPIRGKDKKLSLHTFTAAQWDAQWNDFLPRLQNRGRTKDKGFFAIPFYENISLLAFRRDMISPAVIESWAKLADEGEKWEREHPSPEALFFDFPRGARENYNCLFFEILLSLEGLPDWAGHCQLHEWIHRESAIEACKIYRRLCRRAYLAGGGQDFNGQRKKNAGKYMKVNPSAIVWRHWYSTLNQMMLDMALRDRDQVQVSPLPGRRSVAGEWYLGIPAYSAAPAVGLEIIKLLTSHEAELDRIRVGVGLPTRSTFYDAEQRQSLETAISPFFSMDLGVLKELVETAFARSNFDCYSQFSGVLASHLQEIIRIPDEDEKKVDAKIRGIFELVEARIKFVSPERGCNKCHVKEAQVKLQGLPR